MPAWATVVITLGAAAFTGTFSLGIAWLKSHTDRQDSWHTRQTEAASDFAKKFIGATDAVRYAVEHPEDSDAVHKAVYLAGDVTPFHGPVLLLFASTSPAAAKSAEALETLKLAAKQLAAGDRESAGSSLARSGALWEEFEEAVRREVRR